MTKQPNKYRFYKDNDDKWYIDLPEFIEAGLGNKEDLAMVGGADDLLDYLTDHSDEIILELALDKKWEYWDYIEKASNNPVGTGATYVYQIGAKIIVAWLCPVTMFLFGDYPDVIYFKKEDPSNIKY